LIKLYELLDDYDDTQNVYANFEISDELLATLN
jgi:transcriptional/translational regulatory protein YebC/TACO1